MLEKLALVEERYEELNRLMADPEVAIDHVRLKELAQEQAEIEELAQTYRQYKANEQELRETEAMLQEGGDEELEELAREETERLTARQ